jgi:hypothetical protein
MLPIPAAKTLQTQTKETQNEQLQPNQHPQQHRRNALHRRFFRHLPNRRSRPRTSNYICPNQRPRKMIGMDETPPRPPRLRAK